MTEWPRSTLCDVDWPTVETLLGLTLPDDDEQLVERSATAPSTATSTS